MNQILAVLRKELIDGLRDRRSVVSTLIFPLLGPMMVTFMINLQAERQRESMDIEIPIVGAERAPDIVDWIERSGFGVGAGPEDPEAAVRATATSISSSSCPRTSPQTSPRGAPPK